MKQQTDTTSKQQQQKIDPLMRIQEEIKEELRREREYKKLLIAGGALPYTEDDNDDDAEAESSLLNITQVNETEFSVYNSNGEKHTEESSHSDDSGISAASSPVNGTTVNTSVVQQTSSSITITTTMTTSEEHLRINIKEPRYIGPNCYNLTPDPPKQKLMLRTISTPHLNAVQSRNLTGISTQKGLMQRFIASRGKLQIANNNVRRENENAAAANGLTSNTSSTGALITLNTNSIQSLNAATFNFDKPASTWQPAVIERDQDGRPIRPGYVPVELKIQRELQDLKSRESELKKQRKIRQSTPDLLNALEDESIEYINSVDADEDDDADSTEHCYGPNKMRSAKSIGELNEPMHYFNNNNGKTLRNDETDGMRPAVSLAQLCDLDPEEAPSSHRLIAQWESLIQQNA